jgi:nucleoside-diphosphate-sugar epimerase
MIPPATAGGGAFVLGATGFVGREVVRQLCVRGGKPYAHVRPDSKKLDDWKQKFGELGAEVDATPWDAAALAARWRELKPARIYICIGTTRGKAKSDNVQGNIYEAVDYGLTKLAVDAARGSEIKPRLVYLSSVGADAGARSDYLKWRGKAEDVVKASGLPWAIARPSIITGDRDETRLGEKAAGVVGDGLLAVAWVFGGKKLRDRYRTTTPDVLASALIRIGEAAEHDVIVDGKDLR